MRPYYKDRKPTGGLDRLTEAQVYLRVIEMNGRASAWIGERFGVPPTTITDWRAGRRAPGAGTLSKLRQLARKEVQNV